MAFLRVTPTALLVVMLLNIIVPQYSGVWNALTMVLWILVRILVVLFVAEVARIGVASLPLALPMALAVMMAGHCLGMYVATTGLDALIGFVGLDGVVALVGLLAAGSSMLVLSSRVVLGMMVGKPAISKQEIRMGRLCGRRYRSRKPVRIDQAVGNADMRI